MTVGTLLLTAALLAQVGEVQFGVVATAGTGVAYGPGAGAVLGVAAGRLA